MTTTANTPTDPIRALVSYLDGLVDSEDDTALQTVLAPVRAVVTPPASGSRLFADRLPYFAPGVTDALAEHHPRVGIPGAGEILRRSFEINAGTIRRYFPTASSAWRYLVTDDVRGVFVLRPRAPDGWVCLFYWALPSEAAEELAPLAPPPPPLPRVDLDDLQVRVQRVTELVDSLASEEDLPECRAVIDPLRAAVALPPHTFE